jgi:hypothetical protein
MMEATIEKQELYPKVVVYKNTIPDHKKYMDLLKKSEAEEPYGFFSKWDQWYTFGTMMNLSMNDPSMNNDIDESDEYLILQRDFINTITDVFYKVTLDYINEHNVQLPNWVPSGIAVCKYFESREDTGLAMSYHTDYKWADADAPGDKFAITCTVYLNDDYDGGGISFLHDESGDVINYKPKAGDIIVFPSGDPVTGNQHYFHGVDKISNGEKYFIRLFWMYNYPGSKEWLENREKYGEEEWSRIYNIKVKSEFRSGKWHKYVVYPGEEDPKYANSTPFFKK